MPQGGWRDLAVDVPQPVLFQRDDGTIADVDDLLRRIGLRTTDFSDAPTHKPKPLKDPTRCKNGHLWADHEYKIPGRLTRYCKACKDDSRMRARASAKASAERLKAA